MEDTQNIAAPAVQSEDTSQGTRDIDQLVIPDQGQDGQLGGQETAAGGAQPKEPGQQPPAGGNQAPEMTLEQAKAELERMQADYRNMQAAHTRSTQEIAQAKAAMQFFQRAGVTPEQLIAALEAEEREQLSDPSLVPIVQHFEQRLQPLQELQQQLLEQREEAQVEADIQSLKTGPLARLFEERSDQVLKLAYEEDLLPSEAFQRLLFSELPTLLGAAEKQGQEKTVAAIQAKRGKMVESSSEAGTLPPQLSEDELVVAKELGISPEEYARFKS